MWHSVSTGYPSSGDRHALAQKRRKKEADDLAREEVESSRKKQRTLWDTLSAPPSKKELDKSTRDKIKGKEEETKTVLLPDTSKSFSEPDARQHRSVLSVPQVGDSENEVLSKLMAILDAVHSGRSIAEATAYSVAPIRCSDAEKIARSQMPPQEYKAWTTFNDGLWRLPELDWENNRLPPPTSTKPLKIARRRAEALNRLYQTDGAHAEHVVWITNNKIEVLPLIKAMARVIGAERNLVGGGNGWSAIQLADLQTINRILSILAQICQQSKSNALQSKISQTQHVLGIYRHRLRASRLNEATTKVHLMDQGTHNLLPPQFKVEKAFPRRGSLGLYRLLSLTAFACDRCGLEKKSKLIAFTKGKWNEHLCNGCYGSLLSRMEVQGDVQ
jgi:hypothetical protein